MRSEYGVPLIVSSPPVPLITAAVATAANVKAAATPTTKAVLTRMSSSRDAVEDWSNPRTVTSERRALRVKRRYDMRNEPVTPFYVPLTGAAFDRHHSGR